jgi:hypothetical protein
LTPPRHADFLSPSAIIRFDCEFSDRLLRHYWLMPAIVISPYFAAITSAPPLMLIIAADDAITPCR